MSRFITVHMAYAINSERSWGISCEFNRSDVAEEWVDYRRGQGWSAYTREQRYEVDDNGQYDCGDDK